jgi:hypothetical protein
MMQIPARSRSGHRNVATARELLLAGQQRAAALEREFADLAQAASSAGTDDEHDPEGATLACPSGTSGWRPGRPR